METLLFYFFGFVLVLASFAMVLSKDVLNAALFLIVVMVHTGIIYCIYGALFLAAVQIMVYAGAVMVLFLFIIMLIPRDSEAGERMFLNKKIPFYLVGLFVFEIMISGGLWPKGFLQESSHFSIENIADQLFGPFIIAFEMVSFILLSALIGVVVISKKEKQIAE